MVVTIPLTKSTCSDISWDPESQILFVMGSVNGIHLREEMGLLVLDGLAESGGKL